MIEVERDTYGLSFYVFTSTSAVLSKPIYIIVACAAKFNIGLACLDHALRSKWRVF